MQSAYKFVRCLCVCVCVFLTNMAAFALPEGFTEFDMFTFGSALLVGGEWTREHQRLPAALKETVQTAAKQKHPLKITKKN